jgi:hypothetical protein
VDGPGIIAATLSVATVADRSGRVWQYHSRSDRHSKVACWAILFDVLQNSGVLRRHVEETKVVFGVNREMRDFRTNRTKDLDLVLARPGTSVDGKTTTTLADLAEKWKLELTSDQHKRLTALPELREGTTGSVLVALEAKACMTAHIKALPRLFDELNSSHDTVHGENEAAIAAGFVMINASETFVSPDMNKPGVAPQTSDHAQPLWARRAVAKISEISRRNTKTGFGFDAVGATLVNMRNDGSPVTIVSGDPAPTTGDSLHYEQMIRRLVHLYDTAYAAI